MERVNGKMERSWGYIDMKQDNNELCKALELIARANYINVNGAYIRYAINVLETGVDISFDLEKKDSVTLFYDRNTPDAYKNSEIYKIEAYFESLEWKIKEKQRKEALIESAKSKLTKEELEALKEGYY